MMTSQIVIKKEEHTHALAIQPFRLTHGRHEHLYTLLSGFAESYVLLV
jgi:hypothetical protein